MVVNKKNIENLNKNINNMDCIKAEETFVPVTEFVLNDTVETSDKFQKFMYELLDKNGVINDLRAYLRGHIVNILKSAETGVLPACQKHFTQRLQFPFQAINILIVEYLLTMEFNYTLSVFISEIPLANMMFEFTKSLLNLDTEAKMSSLQFEDEDIWSILNYIGLKCNSEQALKIVDIYRSEKQPLLLCIFKCVTMYQKEEEHISDQSSITLSSDTTGDKIQTSHRHNSKCKHFFYCKACQNRIARLKEKYTRKKTRIEKKRSSVKKVNVESFMNNVSVLEQTLIEEMFQQLKTVYETELEMVKEEQQKKVQQLIAGHALQLQKHREKMEQSFKAREEELSQAIQQKKRFLWGLARSLREQHENLTRAMSDVRRQTERLSNKENSLKTQLEEAEKTLKKRGEDMRKQISEELVILEGHLKSIKKERDLINEERKEIENLKNIETIVPTEKDFKPQYDFLKTELSVLRKYIEATTLEPKCVIERGTITDFGIKCFMNNENIDFKMEKLATNRVINDLKKQNNIKLSQSNLDDTNDIISEQTSASSIGETGVKRGDTGDIRNAVILDGSTLDIDKVHIRDSRLRVGNIQDGDPGDTREPGNDVDALRQENDRLKNFARQQRDYIQALFNEKDRLQRAMNDRSRPRTAPVVSNYLRGHRGIIEARKCSHGFASDKLQVNAPVGGAALQDTRGWWLRRASGTTLPIHADEEIISKLSVNDTDIQLPDEIYQQNTSNITPPPKQQSASEAGKVREKSPKSCLREAKEKLRNNTVRPSLQKDNDRSSDAMLREAKRRLRKLEIEAEAVEKSYQDFRKRQSVLKEERENIEYVKDNVIKEVANLGLKNKPSENYEKTTSYEKNLPLSFPKESPEAMKKDFDKYFKEYTAKLDFTQLRYANKNSVIQNVKPIPASLENKKEVDYLETPIMEFRKLYQGQRTIKNKVKIAKDIKNEQNHSENKTKSVKSPKTINNNPNKLELQDDVVKNTQKKDAKEIINNIDTKTTLDNEIINEDIDNNKNNLLMVEVENGCDKVVVPEKDQGLLIVVESSVDNRDTSDVEGEQIFTPMTIIVSPKSKGGSKNFESPKEIQSRSVSPEVYKMDGLKPIFRAENKELSSIDLQSEMSKERVESISEVEKNQDDYLDDFSADVDNYNSPSEYGNNSPISLPKMSEDEKYWES